MKAALDNLKEAFGAPQLQVDAQLKMTKKGPTIKLTADGLQDLYIGLLCCRNLLRSAGVAEELDAPATTEGIFQRLPLMLQRRFVRFAVDNVYQIKHMPYKKLMSFIRFAEMKQIPISADFWNLVFETQVSRQRVV